MENKEKEALEKVRQKLEDEFLSKKIYTLSWET